MAPWLQIAHDMGIELQARRTAMAPPAARLSHKHPRPHQNLAFLGAAGWQAEQVARPRLFKTHQRLGAINRGCKCEKSKSSASLA